MKNVADAWSNAWAQTQSLDQVYKGYGARNVMWVFRQMLRGEKCNSILDVGCGAGRYFRFFRSLGFRELCGLEYDEANIEKARALNEEVPDVEIIQGDIRALPSPYEAEHFDAVVSLGLVEHFTYPVDNIRKLLNTVRPGGTVILEMPNFRNCIYYRYNLQRKNELPFHLWWGVKDWCKVLSKVPGCTLEQVQTGDLWARRNYLPRVLHKIWPKLVDAEIAVENRLFRKSGSLAFYKLRKCL